MRTISKMLLGALSLCLTLSLMASESANRPCPVVQMDQVKKTTELEVKGVLRRVDGHWEITAKGKIYRPDFSTSKELVVTAEKLNGKTVLIAGRPEQGLEIRSVETKDGVPIMTYPFYFDAVVVSRIEVVETEAVRETVTVEVSGTLEFRAASLGKPVASKMAGREWVGYVVKVNGQEYLLQLDDANKLADLARRLNGQRVAVTGRLESWSDNAGCVGGPRSYPLIVVSDLGPIAMP